MRNGNGPKIDSENPVLRPPTKMLLKFINTGIKQTRNEITKLRRVIAILSVINILSLTLCDVYPQTHKHTS